MPEQNETPQIDLEKGVITLRKGEDVKAFKLNDENDLTSLVKLGQRGWYLDDEASKELGDLRKTVKNWDTALDAARQSDEAFEQLKYKLETAIGRPFTKREEKQIDEGKTPQVLLDDEENSRLMQQLSTLQKEITELKKSQEVFKSASEKKEIERLQAEISAEAAKLEKKYDGAEGAPKFERQEVFKFASDKGIEDLELAFKMLHFDRLTEHQKKKAVKELSEQKKKREDTFTETGDGTAELKTEPSKAKKRLTYHQLGQEALKVAKDNGLSLFTDE